MFERNFIIVAIIGYIGAMFKDSISRVIYYLSISLRSKIVIDSESPIYLEAVEYVGTLNSKVIRNNVKLSNTFNRRRSEFGLSSSPDDGDYLINEGKFKWLLISMTRFSLMDRELFRISFTFIGRERQSRSDNLQKLLSDNMKTITVSHGLHSNTAPIREKSFDTIYIENKDYILDKIENWKLSKEFYNKHEIPYKLGILLSGSPGTGKTSFILALANMMKYNVSIIPKMDLDRPINLMSGLVSNTIYVLEDVDRMIASASDKRDYDIDILEKDQFITGQSSALLTHTILQLLDGTTTPENIVFVLTTNHKNKLDPAIYRPGRITLDIELDNISENLAIQMVESYGLSENFLDGEVYPINPSYLQNKILLELNS